MADEIGLQTVLAVIEGLQREMGEDRYRPAPFLRKMVAAGRGFLSHNDRRSEGTHA